MRLLVERIRPDVLANREPGSKSGPGIGLGLEWGKLSGSLCAVFGKECKNFKTKIQNFW